MKTEDILKLIKVYEVKKQSIRMISVILIGFMSVTVQAHNNGENHRASPREKLVQRLGSEAAAQRAIDNMKPSARARFLAKERAHPRRVAAMEAMKAKVRKESVWYSIRKVMKHPNCTNCHKIGTTNGSNSQNNEKVNNALTHITHPGRHNNSSCETCHNRVVLGSNPPGAFAVEWDSAPTGQDFSRMSDSSLCNAAKQGVGSHTAQDHLKNDSLILWAIRGGRVAEQSPTRRQAAWSRGIHSWRGTIDKWVSYGMPCP